MKSLNLKRIKKNLGMTIIELIVVMSIISIMSGVMLYNYQDFQSTIGIKALSNDIALKIVEAQKLAMTGKLAPLAQQSYQIQDWKPSYGVYFDKSITHDFDNIPFNKKFIYFADLDNGATKNLVSFTYAPQQCGTGSNYECLDSININKSFYVSDLSVVCKGSAVETSVTNLSLTFTRPDSGPVILSSNGCYGSSANIYLMSSGSSTVHASVTIYNSGRIQIK